MPKYEVMILVDGTLSDSVALASLKSILELFDSLPNFEQQVVSSDPLAYAINKKLIAHRFILTFDLEDAEVLKTFYKMSPLNKAILRHLVINLEKDYGYKATLNPKKIKKSVVNQEKYKKYLEIKSQRTSNIKPNFSTL